MTKLTAEQRRLIRQALDEEVRKNMDNLKHQDRIDRNLLKEIDRRAENSE